MRQILSHEQAAKNRTVVTLHADFSEMLDILAALRNCDVENRQSFTHLLQSGCELFCAKDNGRCALGTTEFTVTLEPSKRLLQLLATRRTVDGVEQ